LNPQGRNDEKRPYSHCLAAGAFDRDLHLPTDPLMLSVNFRFCFPMTSASSSDMGPVLGM
jgi:hypothetical protein